MPDTKYSSSEPPQKEKTLIRGADGALYFVTKDDAPVKLTSEEAEKVAKLIDEAEEDLAKKINKVIPRITPNCTRNARVVIPEVFMD